MRIDLFDGRVKFYLTTKEEGDFNSEAVGVLDRQCAVIRRMGANECLGLRTSSENLNSVVRDSVVDFFPRDDYYLFWRSQKSGSAIITTTRERALSFRLADCPVGVLFHPFEHKLCLLRLGLENLFVDNGRAPSILESAFSAMGTRADETYFWFGGGIQKCCYGTTDKDLVTSLGQRFGEKFCSQIVEKGPHKNDIAIDLHQIILREASRLGLMVRLNVESFVCTSCYGVDRNTSCKMGDYWSDTRDLQKIGGRNLALAMMV